MGDVGSKLHNLLVYLVWNKGIFLARMTRMDTVKTFQFSRNRVLDFLRPAAAGGARSGEARWF